MIGLEFLINIYGFKNKDIAAKLEISAVTVHDWIKGKRKIPVARLEQLSEMFNISEDLFQKNLDEIDKLIIQKEKLKNDLYRATEENEESLWDEFEHANYKLMEKKLFSKLKKSLEISHENNMSDEKFNDTFRLLICYDEFFELINDEKTNVTAVQDIIYSLKHYNKNELDKNALIEKVIKIINDI